MEIFGMYKQTSSFFSFFFNLPHKISNHLSIQRLSATSPDMKLMTLPFFSQIKWLNKTLLFPSKGFTLCPFSSLLSFIKNALRTCCQLSLPLDYTRSQTCPLFFCNGQASNQEWPTPLSLLL